MKRSHILITGAHRSGTTWTGKVLATAAELRYVQEPFNVAISKYKPPFSQWYKFVCDTSSQQEQQNIERYLNSFLSIHPKHFGTSFTKVSTLRGWYHAMADIKNRATHRTLFKDPLLLFSAPWFQKHMNSQIVVLVRHPAAFIASLKVKDWRFDFNHFLEQPLLMETVLHDHSSEIKRFSEHEHDLIDQGILLWNILNNYVQSKQQQQPHGWYFLKHEQLSLEPVQEFKKLCDFAAVSYSKIMHKAILDTTQAKDPQDRHRDSKQNITSWKQRLTTDEIARIKEGTAAVWRYFYSEDDW
ncbi:MAG: sulfotransferase domain-containing protein [Marinirhabdus sp.]|nr:sulfotransferase domain-containing protein [Marinirhabdus sp.]